MTLFMFAVTFADGVPDGYQVFDGEGKRIEGLSGETLAEALIEGGSSITIPKRAWTIFAAASKRASATAACWCCAEARRAA